MAITKLDSQRGVRFRVTYRDGNGKQQTAGTYGTRKQAEKEYGDAKARVRINEPKPVRPVQLYEDTTKRGMSLASYADDWLGTHRLGAHSKANYSGILKAKIKPALGDMPLIDVTTPVVAAFFRELEDAGATNALISKVKCILSSLMQSAAEDPANPVTHNPVRGIRAGGTRPKRRQAISKEQFGRLLAELPADGPWRLMCRTIAGSGIRVEEATALTNDSLVVTDAGAYLNIVGTLVETKGREFTPKGSTKTNKDRMIKISPVLATDLAALPKGFMFTREDGLHIGLDSFRKIVFKPAAKRAGLPPAFTPRDLRRCHASWMKAGGADLEVIRERLGHSSISVTDRYLAQPKDVGDAALLALGDIPG